MYLPRMSVYTTQVCVCLSVNSAGKYSTGKKPCPQTTPKTFSQWGGSRNQCQKESPPHPSPRRQKEEERKREEDRKKKMNEGKTMEKNRKPRQPKTASSGRDEKKKNTMRAQTSIRHPRKVPQDSQSDRRPISNAAAFR